jgi:molybdopterin-guanine dinucleotide biosynthesis protein A
MVGIVNAGGRSTRMGTNKALLRLGGKTLIERVLETLRAVFLEVILLSNDPEAFRHLGVPVFADLIPDVGPLGGIYTGLTVASAGSAFFAACDMPFLDPKLIAYMRDYPGPYDVLVPRTRDGFQPLHAVYTKACLPKIASLIEARVFKIDRLFPEVTVSYVDEDTIRTFDPDLLCLLNVNEPHEFAAAERLWASRGRPVSPPASTE